MTNVTKSIRIPIDTAKRIAAIAKRQERTWNYIAAKLLKEATQQVSLK